MDVATNTESEVSLAGKYLTFTLDTERYGVDVLKVREITGLYPITAIPNAAACVRGVMNLRGRVVPVVDLRTKFQLLSAVDNPHTCIIILDILMDGVIHNVGIVVDAVNDVVNFLAQNLEPAPAYADGMKTSFVKAMGKSADGISILLDVDRLLSPAEVLKDGF